MDGDLFDEIQRLRALGRKAALATIVQMRLKNGHPDVVFEHGVTIDADIVFWDGAFQFFTGSSGCSGGFYIEDIAAHEFGHALGLDHSTMSTATMYPSTSYCNTANRSLDPDDLSGVLAIYGARPGTPTVPTGLRLVR